MLAVGCRPLSRAKLQLHRQSRPCRVGAPPPPQLRVCSCGVHLRVTGWGAERARGTLAAGEGKGTSARQLRGPVRSAVSGGTCNARRVPCKTATARCRAAHCAWLKPWPVGLRTSVDLRYAHVAAALVGSARTPRSVGRPSRAVCLSLPVVPLPGAKEPSRFSVSSEVVELRGRWSRISICVRHMHCVASCVPL